MLRTIGVCLLILAIGSCGAALVEWEYRLAMAGERRAYLSESAGRSNRQRDMVEDALTGIYHSMRTIARLPAVRSLDPATGGAMDRGGGILDAGERLVIQEIYNNLAAEVALSELYLVPVTLDPDGERGDRPREPWVTFDDVIFGRHGGTDDHGAHDEVEEIEIYEYRLMRAQLDAMLAEYPTSDAVDGLAYPMYAGPPVVTCDNSRFDPAHPDDGDRTGIVLSVPIYGDDGSLRGCVSAVMLNHALGDLLGETGFALVNARDGIRIGDTEPADEPLYRDRLAISLPAGSGPWRLAAWRPDSDFEARAGVRAAYVARLVGLGGCGLLTLVLLGSALLIHRARDRMIAAQDALRAANEDLEAQVRERTKRLESLVLSDQLTGLPNRRCFEQRLRRTMMRARRSGEHYGVLFFDFDRFKVVNDSLGHDVGDALLVSIADRFRASLRETDTAARFGGDEFVVLLSPLACPQDAVGVAEKLLDVFAEPHQVGGHAIVSTASIGVVTSEIASGGAEEMIRDADSAMYRAKAMGKGRVVVFDRAQHERAMDRLRLEEDLRGAIDRDELVLLYQPIVDIESGRIAACESLIRWEHPTRGLVSPDEFIPIAEESGLISQIGLWAFTTACASMARWEREGVLPDDFAVTVNVSKRQLLDPDCRDAFERALASHAVSPDRLWLEVTETTIVEHRAGVDETLRDIRSTGMRILMDDFGTGHSSLAGLKDLPVDMLKIDKAFLRSARLNARLIAILQSIVMLTDNLGMDAIGEGVENAEDVATLNALGCRYGQGYHFARPCDEQAMARLLERERISDRSAA